MDDEVFLYYINQAIDGGSGKTQTDILVDAVTNVRYYVKVNTAAAVHGTVLSAADKAALSKKLNDCWTVYGAYYESIGVTKQTVEKIYLSEAYETALLTYFYGEGGEREVAAADILTELNKAFIVYRDIKSSFSKTESDGQTTELTDAERELLISRFKTAAKEINSGTLTVEEAATRLNSENDNTQPDVTAARKGTPLCSEEFFEQVAAAKQGKASVIQSDGAVYLVWREKVTADSGYYTENRLYALMQLKGEELSTLINSENAYDVNMKDSKAAALYDRILKER